VTSAAICVGPAGFSARLASFSAPFASIDKAVTICTLILVGVILFSTLVMHLGVQKYTVADALFRTISVMATGAEMPRRTSSRAAP